jgi:hypothetical protein
MTKRTAKSNLIVGFLDCENLDNNRRSCEDGWVAAEGSHAVVELSVPNT